MAPQIHQFICRSDNYGVLLHDPNTQATAAVDAPDGDAVLAALDQRGWKLTDILVTHHHGDHVDGIPALRQKFPDVKITAPEKDRQRIGGAEAYVCEGNDVAVGSMTARVIETPGHTTGHIVFWFGEAALLFAGDTLFAMGCGRVLETPMSTMWASLQKLMKLPRDTQVYCGHEYTMANAKFALSVDGGNRRLQERAKAVEAMRADKQMTLPSTLGLELDTNPFLRVADSQIQAAVGMTGEDDAAVFAEVRKRKDRF